jgi:hypothetical protein
VVPSPIASYVDVPLRESKTRIYHSSSGAPNDEFKIDQVQLHDSHASAAISVTNVLTVAGGSVLSIKVRSDQSLPAYFANLHFHVTKISD